MIIVLSILAGSLAITAWVLNFILNGNARYWTDRGVTMGKTPNLLSRFLAKDFTFHRTDMGIYKQLKGKRFGGYMELWRPVLFITDLELAKRIYIKDFDHFVNRRSIEIEKHDPHFHLVLFNQSGDKWKNLRSRMSPTFTTGRIRRMFNIFDSSAKKMIRCINQKVRVQSEIELRPFIQDLAMDIIASAAFGIETNLFEDRTSLFIKMGKEIQQTFAGKAVFKFFLLSMFPKLGEMLKIRITNVDTDRFLSKLIVDSLKHRAKTNEKRDDFLQLMIEARQGKLKAEDESQLDAYEKDAKLKDVPVDSDLVFDDDLIIAQSMLFFLGGFDTLDGLLSFALYELGVNPDIQEKLYHEVKAAVDENGGEFSYDIVNNLEYLDMVISETLRKYPIGVRSERKCNKAYTIPDSDVTVEKDILVAIPVYAIHHDPEYYPDPEKFIPSRFTKENISKRHPFAYQPFGHGPRNCIGNRFALSETKVAVAQLILNFKLEPCKKTVIPIVLANQGPLKPEDNICMKVTPRN
ncbi:unnamed protein product [Allacma fusca]|uniref:Cytochrome P450 n=1 Tax=Allacma fusca TaxID=39272 RepID=A0A8J2JYB8_9HEXA|nr:unnamed protein product [Allacma fusca]